MMQPAKGNIMAKQFDADFKAAFKRNWIRDAMDNGYSKSEAETSYAQQEYAEPEGGSGQ